MRPAYLVGSATFSTRLPPPEFDDVDWAADPHSSRSWRFEVHTLSWLREEEDPARAVRVALDWVERNPQDAPQTDVAWIDMSTARRGPRLAELAELAADARDAERLREAAAEHADWLADNANFSYRGNHGLFQSEGLLLLARALPDHPRSAWWEQQANDRLTELLERTVDARSGVHLEHSPTYQLVVINILRRVSQLTDRHAGMLERMVEAASWMVTPALTLAQIGDSHATYVGASGARRLGVRDGVHRMPGYVAARSGGSYLLVACARHSTAHAQDDDGTFVWWHDGHEVVCDTGVYAYDKHDPRRRHALSPAAHSTLQVDGYDIRRAHRTFYGDGIQDVAVTSEETTIVVSHPRLEEVGYSRTFRLRPGGVLIVEDDVASETQRRYTRRLHLRHADAADVLADADSHRVVADWTSPSFREVVPTCTHVLEDVGTSMTLRAELHAR